MKAFFKKVGKAVVTVFYDPEFRDSGKALLALFVVRFLLALGASQVVIDFVESVLGG
jgi:hypothetical protein